MSVTATTAVRAAASWLAGRHVSVAGDWLEACVAWILEESKGMRLTQDQINVAVYNQWLVADLHEIQSSCLPADLLSKPCMTLTGCYCVQIDSLRDISQPCYAQLTKITGTENENVSVTAFDKSANRKWEPKPTRVLMLSLTDGSISDLQAFEYSPISSLSVDLPAGTKALLKGPITCRSGVLLLTNVNITVLGGEVDGLKAANCQQAVLRRALGELNDDAGKHVPAGGFGARDTAPLAAVGIGLSAGGSVAALAGSGSVERRVGQQQAAAPATGGPLVAARLSAAAVAAAAAPSAAAVTHRSSAAAPTCATATAAAGLSLTNVKGEIRQLEFDIADFDDDDFDDYVGVGAGDGSAVPSRAQPLPVKKSPDTAHSAKIFAQDVRDISNGAHRPDAASTRSPAVSVSSRVMPTTSSTESSRLPSSMGAHRTVSQSLAIGVVGSIAQKRLASATAAADFLDDEDEFFDESDFEQNFQDADEFDCNNFAFDDDVSAMDVEETRVVPVPAAATPVTDARSYSWHLNSAGGTDKRKQTDFSTTGPSGDRRLGCESVHEGHEHDETSDEDCMVVAIESSASSRRRRGRLRLTSTSSSEDRKTSDLSSDVGTSCFQSASAAAPATDEGKLYPASQEPAVPLQDSNNSDAVLGPPFSYLNIIKDLMRSLTEPRTFVVKAYVRTLTGNLKLNKHRGWALSACINDGSAGLEVVFSDKVLESLIGHSAQDFARLRKTWEDGGAEALAGCQRQLANLSCLMEIDVAPPPLSDRSNAESSGGCGGSLPSVAKLREIAATDVRLLKERVARRCPL